MNKIKTILNTIITLNKTEIFTVFGAGRCYCSHTEKGPYNYIGSTDSKSICNDNCLAQGYKPNERYELKPDCNKACLGTCLMKCYLHPIGTIDEYGGADSGWIDMCKNNCYEPCNCALVYTTS